jgi:hypothetical protein
MRDTVRTWASIRKTKWMKQHDCWNCRGAHLRRKRESCLADRLQKSIFQLPQWRSEQNWILSGLRGKGSQQLCLDRITDVHPTENKSRVVQEKALSWKVGKYTHLELAKPTAQTLRKNATFNGRSWHVQWWTQHLIRNRKLIAGTIKALKEDC